MANYIDNIKDQEDNIIYPITKANAVFLDDDTTIENKLTNGMVNNSDMLDGKHASEFLGQLSIFEGDIDGLKDFGTYKITSNTTGTFSNFLNKNSTLIVLSGEKNSIVTQIALPYNKSNLFIRTFDGANWSQWKGDFTNEEVLIGDTSVSTEARTTIMNQWSNLPDGNYTVNAMQGTVATGYVQKIDSGTYGSVILHNYGNYVFHGTVNNGVWKWEQLLKEGHIVNDLTTTGIGYVLDARQGKILNDKIDELSKAMKVTININASSYTECIRSLVTELMTYSNNTYIVKGVWVGNYHFIGLFNCSTDFVLGHMIIGTEKCFNIFKTKTAFQISESTYTTILYE